MESVIFVHVPRTAGTSIHQSFVEPYGARRFVVDSPLKLEPLADKIPGDRAFYLGGHVTLPEVEQELGVDWRTTVNFTVVRDPVDRVVSLCHFMSKYPESNGSLSRAVAGRGLAFFVEYVAADFPEFICNTHCRMIGGLPDFEATCERMAASFNVVAGSALQAALSEVRQLAGVASPLELDHLYGVDRTEAPTPAVRDRILELNAEDLKLHRLVEDEGGLLMNARTR